MNKKGTHVDWVISMGIFIVYVFALFILLRPGIKPVHRPVTLLNVLEEGFSEEVMWTVKVVPLFVRNCGSSIDGDTPSVSIEDSSGSWNLGIIKDEIKVDEKTWNNKLVCSGDLDLERSGKDIQFNFYFYEVNEGIPSFVEDCSSDCLVDIGIVEDIEGIDTGKLSGLIDYDALHELWEIPEGKEFAILKNTDELVGVKPDSQANVFVRKITTQTVSKEGYTEPISIYLQVW